LLKIRYILRLPFILFCFKTLLVFGQKQIGPDSVFYVYNSPFFKNFITKTTRNLTFEAGSLNQVSSIDLSVFKMSSGDFIKMKGALYFHFHNSGRIYKCQPLDPESDSLRFVRLDATVNYNYNIGAYIFPVGENIYEYGGYGFWKSNGVVRKFNFKDREWDVVVLDREVHMPAATSYGHSVWLDSSQQFLYVPYQRIVNDGITKLNDESSNLLTSYRLNLKSFRWEFLGKTNPAVLNLLRSPYRVFSTTNGLFAAYTSRLCWIDFESNSIKVLTDPSLTQTLQRIQSFMLWYWDRQHIFWLNPSNGRYDSLFIDPSRFTSYTNEIWRKPQEWSDYAGGILMLVAAAVLTAAQYKKRKLILNKGKSQTEESKHPFAATELSLLDLLITKQQKGLTVTIPEINYVLGLKDKNQGMQKKVRSDVINRVNEKYSFLIQEKVSLIQNIRSETDKRFFEYYLNPDHLERLRSLLS